MSRSIMKDLETQLSAANHELELATFMNKGILQTNTEYKLRLVELEAENAILRKAEARLARTEDKLEAAERAVRTMGREKEQWEGEMQKELELREGAERERDEWERRYWGLRGRIEGLLSAEGAEGGDDGQKDEGDVEGEGGAGPSKVTKTRTRASSPGMRTKAPPSSKRKPRPSAGHPITPSKSTAVAPGAAPTKPSSSPVRPPPRARSKKRRRVQDSGSDDESAVEDVGGAEEEENGGREESDPLGGGEGYDLTPSPSPPPVSSTRRPLSSSKKPSHRPSAAVATQAQITPTNSKIKRREIASTRRGVGVVAETKVKAEPISPGYGRRREAEDEDSDDDPLAMM